MSGVYVTDLNYGSTKLIASKHHDQTRQAARYTIPRQFWKWDVAVAYAFIYSRLSGKRFTVRRFGTTNGGLPVWEIRPAA